MIQNKNNDNSTNKITLKNVAGNIEAKSMVNDIINFIKNPDKYSEVGARMPKGLLFYGPPGTGKTLMAKAIAGEAGVAFYSISGSDFVQMYVGVGASRIRSLFKKAKKSEKAIIFIDEIDAIGKKRGRNSSASNDERDQTLNALLTEMSGFNENDGIVVIGASNDIQKASSMIFDYINKFGMDNDLGLFSTEIFESNTDYKLINKCRSKINELYKQTYNLLLNNKNILINIVNELLEKESLNSEDIDNLFNN